MLAAEADAAKDQPNSPAATTATTTSPASPRTVDDGSLRKFRTISRKFTFRSNTLRRNSLVGVWPFDEHSSDAAESPRGSVTDRPTTGQLSTPRSASGGGEVKPSTPTKASPLSPSTSPEGKKDKDKKDKKDKKRQSKGNKGSEAATAPTTDSTTAPESLPPASLAPPPLQDTDFGDYEEYSFRNETIMEVVYNMMLFGQRRALHDQIARWYVPAFRLSYRPEHSNVARYEVNHAQNISAFAPILGYHWKLSEQNNKGAARYYTTAGEQALRNFSNSEAVQFFTEALQLSKKHKTRSKQGLVGVMTTGIRKTLPVRSAEDPNELYDTVLLHRKLGQAYYNLGNFDYANRHLRLVLKHVKVPLASLDQGKVPDVPDDKLLKDLSGLMSVCIRRGDSVWAKFLTFWSVRTHHTSCEKPS